MKTDHTLAAAGQPTELEKRLAESRGGLEIELGKLSPVAGDVVVMRVHPDTSTKMITDMLGHMKQQLPEGVKLIGLFEDVDIEHLSADDMATFGWVHRDAVPGLQEEIAEINRHIREEATGMDAILSELEDFVSHEPRDQVFDSGERTFVADYVKLIIARHRSAPCVQQPVSVGEPTAELVEDPASGIGDIYFTEPGDQQYLTPVELTDEQVEGIKGAEVGE